MGYLFSQLWLCLGTALLLGGVTGWFLRGDNRKKLDIIEQRWRKRFMELEYVNQALQNQNKQHKVSETQKLQLESRLSRMNRAAELSSQELKYKASKLAQLEQQLEQVRTELSDKSNQLDDMVSKLSEMESTPKNWQAANSETRTGDASPPIRESDRELLAEQIAEKNREIKQLQKKLDACEQDCQQMEEKQARLTETNDHYKASLIDAESKLQVTHELLAEKNQALEKMEALNKTLKKHNNH